MPPEMNTFLISLNTKKSVFQSNKLKVLVLSLYEVGQPVKATNLKEDWKMQIT